MLKRKIYKELIKFKQERRKKQKHALLVKGARQVGKTSIIREFGNKEYKCYIELNFLTNPEYKEIFNGSLSPKDILNKISLMLPSFKLIPGNTLLFFDEIQCCGNARTSVKFLSEDFSFDVIESGSLLGLSYGENGDKNIEIPNSIPVGYEKQIIMNSLDFEEYLWAKGYRNNHIQILKGYFDNLKKIDKSLLYVFESIFREFIIIGGMPEVVEKYISTNNYNYAFDIQEKIISNYRDDISKYSKGIEKVKVRQCYDSIVKQLSKEYTKFKYSIVEKGQTRRKFENAITWLVDSNLVNKCDNISKPKIPLLGYEIDNEFKLYLNDTGLLTSMFGRSIKLGIKNNTLTGNIKGGIYENVIAECLVKNGYKLHYYHPNDNHELEFLIEKDVGVIPIEVKAGNSSSVSLNNYIKSYKPKKAYKFTSSNIGVVDNKITLPHFMIMFI